MIQSPTANAALPAGFAEQLAVLQFIGYSGVGNQAAKGRVKNGN
jgi:hypothetical protein